MNGILKTLSHIFICSILLCTSHVYGEESIGIRINPHDTKTNISGTVILEIPKGYYVYANPKGKGIGQATEISLLGKSNKFKMRVNYPVGEEYSPDSKSLSVNIYRGNIEIPISIEGNNNPGDVIISLRVLMCSDKSCIPMTSTMNVKVSGVENILLKLGSFSGSLVSKYESTKGEINIGNGIVDAEEQNEFLPIYIQNDEVSGIFQAILIGLIAGFILNLMPCVLPVIGLKVMALVQNAEDEGLPVFLYSLIFSLGIITSFMILAVLAAFWGFQWGALFQNSIFIVFMIFFMFTLALSMFGLFKFHVPGFICRASANNRRSPGDAYIKGIIATLLATPCSGPFLGGILGWSLTQQPLIIFTVFMSIGTGMALPYLILAFKPGLLKFMPKPGFWMIVLEKIMGLLMVGTVAYLIYILSSSERKSVLLALFIFFLVFIIIHKYFDSLNIKFKRSLFVCLLIVTGASVYGYSKNYIFNEPVQVEIVSNNFTMMKLKQNSSVGKISVVEFTADWCPNCKLLEFTVLRSEEMERVFSNSGIEFITADLTRTNEEAEKLLSKLGSKSIPFLAVFPAGEKFNNPICLRDIYSIGELKKAIRMAESVK